MFWSQAWVQCCENYHLINLQRRFSWGFVKTFHKSVVGDVLILVLLSASYRTGPHRD